MKEYRTPHAMRAFARVYILLLPVLFAPSLVHHVGATSDTWEGGGGDQQRRRLALAAGVGAAVSAMLGGLYSVELAIENPFSPSLDAVRARHELSQMKISLERLEADAKVQRAWQLPLDSDHEDESVDVILERSFRAASAADRAGGVGLATVSVVAGAAEAAGI